MSSYYNENDGYAAQWLRNLIRAGHIAPGDVDERDVREVRADDVGGYAQCHFFAGIGGWSLALRLAGWGDDRPVWTGSCPCQPFSAAGKGKGGADERHLWPHWRGLIGERRPGTIFGEQVAAAIGWGWWDAVAADLEAEGYAAGACVLGAHSSGAPHIRQRLWFVAHSASVGLEGAAGAAGTIGRDISGFSCCGDTGFVADAHEGGCSVERGGRLLDGERPAQRDHTDGRLSAGIADPWSDCVWLPCTDGKARPVEPTIQPLAHAGQWGSGSRVGMLRAAGNCIIPQVAAEFIRAAALTD